jgi:RNA polymerase sigma-70 factor (family 1)
VKRTIDELEFRKIYRLHGKQVWRVCYSVIKDEEIAKGLTQDIFLYLWDKRATVRINGPIEHYLVRAAKLRTYEYIRNQTVRRRHAESVLNDSEPTANCTEQEIMSADLNSRVQTLLAELTDQNRQIFNLREDGLTNKEIGVVMNLTEKSVEYHITRVLAHLKKNLSEFLVSV